MGKHAGQMDWNLQYVITLKEIAIQMIHRWQLSLDKLSKNVPKGLQAYAVRIFLKKCKNQEGTFCYLWWSNIAQAISGGGTYNFLKIET